MNWGDLFCYDESSPSGLVWKHTAYRGKGYNVVHRSAGSRAGYKNPRGRWVVAIGKKNYFSHRIVYEMTSNTTLGGLSVDHIDGNPSNNRLSNLRAVTSSGNNRNRGPTNNTSGVVGVAKNGNSFTAQWYENGGKCSSSFSILKYGSIGALQLATEARSSAIRDMNRHGAGYTKRHVLLEVVT